MLYKYLKCFLILNYFIVFCLASLSAQASQETMGASFSQNLPFLTKIYKTKKGDTLSSIAKIYHIGVMGLKSINQKHKFFTNVQQILPENTNLIVPQSPLADAERTQFQQKMH